MKRNSGIAWAPPILLPVSLSENSSSSHYSLLRTHILILSNINYMPHISKHRYRCLEDIPAHIFSFLVRDWNRKSNLFKIFLIDDQPDFESVSNFSKNNQHLAGMKNYFGVRIWVMDFVRSWLESDPYGGLTYRSYIEKILSLMLNWGDKNNRTPKLKYRTSNVEVGVKEKITHHIKLG
ncbi:hypothetical protein RhiirA5_370927 [Rhizophagus irregularis]|uniref:Uncharacterized protein n=1 Tax=Rhizophagus irregularis TaxID=588596 RepID=A0A2N0SG49_9GLOM|nr:hypothetical protein RhiirA5_370927 [Rhizophagus irregularis]PKC74524.1 hypothetical protein RhiirA1_388055 [Rhizophagus irregularis]